jgi:O-antigen/teichoic acid export membrane protein
MPERGARVTAEAQLNRLARGSALNIVGSVVQQASMFFTTALIARALGSSDLGAYALVYALLSVLGLVAMCGFRASLTRFVAIQLADDDDARVRGTIRLCVGVSVVLSVLMAAVMLVFAPALGHVFHGHDMALGVACVAIALPGATIRDTALAATQGWRTQRAFTMIGWIYEPVVRLVLTAVLIALGFGLVGTWAALLFGTWTAAGTAWLALRRRTARLERGQVVTDTRGIFSFSLVSWGTTLASSGLIWADTLLLGHFRSAADVGLYTVATRLVTLAVFVMAPINAAFAPQFAHHFHLGERSAMAQTYTAATGWILRLSLPAFAVLVIFPRGLLGLFGDDYRTGAAVTVALAIGQLINALTGPCGTALNMAGRVHLNMVNNIVALGLNIGLNLWLIPAHGAYGAAIAWMVSLSVVNVARLLETYFVVRTWPFDLGTVKALAAGMIASLAGLALRGLLGQGTAALVVSLAGLVVVYVAVTVVLGFQPRETEVINALRRRDLRRV